MFKKLLLTFLLIFLSNSFVSADEFFPSGDSDLNKYYDALGYSIGNIPENKECPGCIEYNSEDLVGENTDYVLNNVDITDITSKDPKYGLIRTLNVMDRVSIPPDSKIDFIYWAQNEDSNDINVSEIKMFLSRYDPSKGNLLNLLNMSGTYEELALKYMVWNYPRHGYLKSYDGLGIVSANTILNPLILDSALVKRSLDFINWSANIDGQFAEISILVRNSSPYPLKDVIFRHKEFTRTKDFDIGEEYLFNKFNLGWPPSIGII